MAELIGVLSSGAGIASLAIQISQQVREMKDFVRCLKSAPEDINSLVNEISILNELLFTSASSFELHSDTGDRCGQLCRKAAEFLSDSLKVSQQKLDRQKLWGRIEFVLKRGDLEKCVGKLERTRNMLQFAHLISQGQAIGLLVQRSNEPKQGLGTAAETLIITDQNSSAPIVPLPKASLLSHFKQFGGSTSNGILVSKRRRVMDPILRFPSPIWLSGKVWELYSYRAQTEWSLYLRTYNVIRRDSLIFQYAKDGNVPGIQDLLQRNLASVSDCDDIGRTALYVSASYRKKAACRLLLDEGADPYVRCTSPGRWNVLEALIFCQFCDSQEWDNDATELATMLVSETAEEFIGLESVPRIRCEGSNTQTQKLLARAIYPPIDKQPLLNRVDFVLNLYHKAHQASSPEILMEILNFDDMAASKQRLIPNIICGLGNSLVWDSPHIDRFRSLLARMVRIGADLTAVYPTSDPTRKYTPLLLFMQSFETTKSLHPTFQQKGKGHSERKRLRQFMPFNIWISELYNAGVDLTLYGQQEKLLHSRGMVDPEINISRIRSSILFDTECLRLVSFFYGPIPEDWHAWFSNSRDEYSGEFWDMVDHPERRMPGAWDG